MEHYAAKAFVMETHDLLRKAAAGALTEEEEDRVLALEDAAIEMINNKKYLTEFRIIRDDGAGPSDDEKHVNFNSHSEIEEFAVEPKTKLVEFPNGDIKKLAYKTYVAYSKGYEVPDGVTEAGHPKVRVTRDSVSSGPEGFIEREGEHLPFGAASALVARLLEVKGSI